MILVLPATVHQPSRFRPVDQAHDAVMLEQQVVGDLTDGRTRRAAVTSNGQHQLVLRRGQTGFLGGLGTPALESSQPGPQRQQPGVVGLSQVLSRHDKIVLR